MDYISSRKVKNFFALCEAPPLKSFFLSALQPMNAGIKKGEGIRGVVIKGVGML